MLRESEKGGNPCVVVGSCHVGTQAVVDNLLSDETWTQIELC